jgi:hypothetical protein
LKYLLIYLAYGSTYTRVYHVFSTYFKSNILFLISLKQKYIIHAQDKKADLLEFLIKRFNYKPLFGHSPEVNKIENKTFRFDFGFFLKSEFHQSCIQLVILLAQRPLEVKLEDFSDLVHEQIGECRKSFFLLASLCFYRRSKFRLASVFTW